MTDTPTERPRALVLGASRGIGAAVVRRLASDGFAVTAVARSADGLAAAVAGLDAASVVADLATPAGRRALAESTAAAGQPHVVVSVVHVRRPWARITRTDPAEYAAAVDDHLGHLVEVATAAVPAQRAAGYGRWIFVSTLTAAMGGHGQGTYVAHKAAVEGFARTLAVEEGRHGVTANVVVPGYIATENTESRYSDAQRAAFAASSVVERAGTADEVAHAVSFLADRRAGFVTGAQIPVTGGAELGWWLARAAAVDRSTGGAATS